ncbi:MAG TPA: metalloregulator ArsR/SmtB family transcription factor [Candidatus Thermoplasmatota archaeon]|nr:metalloregulator ArsR/SmtB family transcription factor [Candidatus Thermoplasmatota archaeon]
MSDRLTLVFHALADPTRRHMLERLLEGEATVNELADPLPISQPGVSKHLKVLEAAGLVERRRDATRRWASIRCAPLKEVIRWTSEFQRLWDESFARLDDVLQDEKRKPRARR